MCDILACADNVRQGDEALALRSIRDVASDFVETHEE
jgi:hypothetical protein